MTRTLQDLRDEAAKRLDAGQALHALKVERLLLEAVPLDFDLRLEIGDRLVRLGADKLAGAVYTAVADHDTRSGNPLRAMVAAKLIDTMGMAAAPLVSAIAARYAAGSDALGRSVRPAPEDYSAKVRDDIDLDYAIDERELLEGTARMAAYTENIKNYPAVVPPVAIFSTLAREPFVKLFERLKLRRHKQGDVIIREGTQGDAIYFLARGEVCVTRSVEKAGERLEVRLARLGPGSLFGEMALVSADPRGASVICETPCDLLELKKAQIELLAAELPALSVAMARFTQERLISNLLATNPLFTPFDEESRKQLLGRFTGHEVPGGTIFLEQETTGPGLYVILQGRAEVLKFDAGAYVKVADLGPGDVVGEISLLHEQPISATVRTTTPATLLFLARELFLPLVEAVPDLLAHFARLAEERLDDTEFKLMQNKVVDDDFVESLEEDDDELSGDDLVFI
jgi:CRP-like cAMP-binding protein